MPLRLPQWPWSLSFAMRRDALAGPTVDKEWPPGLPQSVPSEYLFDLPSAREFVKHAPDCQLAAAAWDIQLWRKVSCSARGVVMAVTFPERLHACAVCAAGSQGSGEADAAPEPSNGQEAPIDCLTCRNSGTGSGASWRVSGPRTCHESLFACVYARVAASENASNFGQVQSGRSRSSPTRYALRAPPIDYTNCPPNVLPKTM